MTDTRRYDIRFGKVTYAPGAPKNAPRGVWRCGCDECAPLGIRAVHGPFRTRREAERDAGETCVLVASEPGGGVN
jgi:hypothetical protein